MANCLGTTKLEIKDQEEEKITKGPDENPVDHIYIVLARVQPWKWSLYVVLARVQPWKWSLITDLDTGHASS